MSENTVEAYIRDVKKLEVFALQSGKLPSELDTNDISDFLKHLNTNHMISNNSQARIISSLRCFFKFLILENICKNNPIESIESNKVYIKLPEILEPYEIEQMLSILTTSKCPYEIRNKTIVETMYGTGMRVSELTNLKVSDIFINDNVIKVLGKGNKERLIPIGSIASECISAYLINIRPVLSNSLAPTNFLFLNKRGNKLSRIMIFNIIRNLALEANITKRVSPHILRHSYATHLIEGGADIRSVQQLLGHVSINSTEIYTHLDKKHLRQVIHEFHPRSK